MRRRFLLALLVLSGLSGLAYELIWVRLLTASMGSTTLSFSTVLAVYFGGLAIGSRWAGTRLSRARAPLRTYGVLETLTGVLGVVLYPLMTSLGTLFAAIDPGHSGGGLVLRVAVSAVLLLPPTFVMGATLPYVCLATIERDADSGRGTALVYGFNTLGACLGAYAVTFWMLPSLGVLASTLIVAGVNLLVGAIAVLASRRSDGPAAEAPVSEATETTPAKQRRLVQVTAFVGGFVAVAAQVVWGRTFAIVLGGTAYGIGSVLVSVLVGIAIGSLVAARLARRANLVLVFSALQLVLLSGFAIFSWTIPLVDYGVTSLLASGYSPERQHHVELGFVLIALAIPTIASGASLPLLVAIVEHSARGAGTTLSRLYATNTAGCILGSVSAGYVLLPFLGTNQTLYLLAVLLAANVAIFSLVLGRARLGWAASVAVGSLAIVAVYPEIDVEALTFRTWGTVGDYFTNTRNQRSRASHTIFFEEGDVATVLVRLREGEHGLLLNGLPQGGRQRYPPHVVVESLLVGLVPVAHAATPHRGLVVGLGAGGTIRALLDLGVGVEQVDVVELERSVAQGVDLIWGADNPLKDPRVHLEVDDARHFLNVKARRAPHGYDFITSMPAHPWVSPALFTREFFEIAAQNLSNGGVFSTWFGINGLDPAVVESLLGAFTAAFPHWAVYFVPEAAALYLVGGNELLHLDVDRWDTMAATSLMRGVPPTIRAREFLPVSVIVVGAGPTGGRINTDDNAFVEFHPPRLGAPLPSLDALRARGRRAHSREQFRTANVDALLLAMAERALGTPEGRLPWVAPLPASQRFVEHLASQAPDISDYLGVRLLLAQQGKRADAAAKSAGIKRDDLRQRAERMIAASAPVESERRASLQALAAPTADVKALLVALGTEVQSSDEPPTADADPLGWLFVAPERVPALTPAQRAETAAPLLRRLQVYASHRLYERCERFAKSSGWSELSGECAVAGLGARRKESLDAANTAFAAGEKGRFKDASDLLWAAHQLSPLADEQLRALLGASIAAGLDERVELAKETMRLRGQPREVIDAMVKELREHPELIRPSKPEVPISPDQQPAQPPVME